MGDMDRQSPQDAQDGAAVPWDSVIDQDPQEISRLIDAEDRPEQEPAQEGPLAQAMETTTAAETKAPSGEPLATLSEPAVAQPTELEAPLPADEAPPAAAETVRPLSRPRQQLLLPSAAMHEMATPIAVDAIAPLPSAAESAATIAPTVAAEPMGATSLPVDASLVAAATVAADSSPVTPPAILVRDVQIAPSAPEAVLTMTAPAAPIAEPIQGDASVPAWSAEEIGPLVTDEEEMAVATSPSGGGWTIPLLCAGLALIACCVLLPQADANRRLAYEQEKLRQDLQFVQRQVALNAEFLKKVADDPTLAERLASRQMKVTREGTDVLPLKGESNEDVSPFLLVNMAPPPPPAPYRAIGGQLAELCRRPKSRLYLLGGGLLLVAAGLVLGGEGKGR